MTPSKGLETVNKALPAYWPNLKFLGDFHSHPWTAREPWPKRPFLSESDRNSIENDAAYAQLDFRVALLLNIQKLGRKGSMMPNFTHDNTLEFRMNDLRMSLAAWVACPAKNDAKEPALYVIPRPVAVAQDQVEARAVAFEVPADERQEGLAERAGPSLPDIARGLRTSAHDLRWDRGTPWRSFMIMSASGVARSGKEHERSWNLTLPTAFHRLAMSWEAFVTKSLSRVGSFFTALVLVLALSSCGYNTIPTLEEQAKAKWADVQNNYQRRADLIPNLVATVQGYAKQEKDVLTAVVEARAKATQVKIDASQLTDPEKLKQFQDAQNQLSGALGRLLAVSENYPDLKSNQNFLALQSQLEGTENRIAVARRDYIEAVRAYNTELKTFPGVLWAATFFRGEQADGRVRRERQCADAAASEVLTRRAGADMIAGASGSARTMRPFAARARSALLSRRRRSPPNFPALTGRIVDQANVIPADDAHGARAQARRSRGQVRHPARRRHRHLARGRGDRALRQRAVPRLEARREDQEQRRAAAGRAERAAGAHRGRLRARGHAHRRAVQGHHHQRHRAALQGRRFRRRHLARRRRHHHGADDRLLGMAAAAVAAPRQIQQPADRRAGCSSPG